MRKNITALFLAVVMAVTLLPAAFAAGNGYSDTQGHWGEDAIDRWSGYGVISGTGNGLFDPSAPLTRAQAAQIFANLLNLSATASVAQYTDVAVGSWYYDAIAKCVAAGILNGTGSNTMSPNTYVSREELFVMFARALGIQPQASAGVTFTDSASTASWAAGYVNALADMGVVGGSGDGTLAPKADIDRASVVALLDKAITAYGNTSGATVGSSSGIVLVVADNVTVMGSVETLVVAGGSAGISGSTVGTISVVGESASVSVGGSANVGQVSVTGANASVTVRGEATVSGVTIADTAQGAELTVSGDATVTAVDSAAQNVTISGDGTIEAATVSGDNTTVDTNGTDLTVSEGTTGVTENDRNVSAGDTVVTEPAEDTGSSGESTTPSRPTNPSRPSYDYYTVTFMLDENTVYDTQRVREGSSVEQPENPTKEGYSFGGWYLNGAAYDFTAPVTGNITLIAQWNENATVTFVSEGVTLSTQEIVPGGTVTRPADPTTTQLCKTFGGWYAEGSETTYDFATPVNADLTLVAKWADAHTYEMREIRAADAPDTTVATQEVCSVCGKELDIVPNGNAAAQVDSDYYVDVANALSAADNAMVTMLKDAVFTDTCIVTGTVTLDMNGHTISNTSSIWVDTDEVDKWSLISVRGNGNLTITGNGTLSTLENDIYAVDIYDATSSCTIESGTFIGNIHAVYVFNGSLTVNGGAYSIQQVYPDSSRPYEFVLNCYDDSREAGTAKITVTGGTFENFNPADCTAEGEGTNFVAEGYTVTSEKIGEDTWYTVVPLTAENSAAEVNGVYYENLTDAIAAADGGTVTLQKDIELSTDTGIELKANVPVTVDLNNFTLSVSKRVYTKEDLEADSSLTNNCIDAENGKSITFIDGQLDFTCGNVGIYVGKDSTVTLNNVDYTCNSDPFLIYENAAALNVIDCEITAGSDAYYCVSTNAATPENYGVTINIVGSTLDSTQTSGGTAILFNIPGTLKITDSTINSVLHSVIARGGDVTITNSLLNNQVAPSDYENMGDYFNNQNWGTGNMVTVAALTIGNKHPSSYQYSTHCTLINTQITVGTGQRTVHISGNETEEIGAFLTYDESSDIGTIDYGTGYISVNGEVHTDDTAD